MGKPLIVVNATASHSGGARTILNELANLALQISDYEFIFYTSHKPEETQETLNFRIVNRQTKKERIQWELSGLAKDLKKQNESPALVISLHNMGVKGVDCPKLVLFHQALLFEKQKGLKSKLMAWIYKRLIQRIDDAKTFYLTQSSALGLKISKNLQIDQVRTDVIKHILEFPKVSSEVKRLDEYFYPALPYAHKNFGLILEIAKLTELEGLKISLTCTKIDFCKLTACEIQNLPKSIYFLGHLTYLATLERLASSKALLFPSLVESLGLPMLEAAFMGKPILAANLSYSKEILDGYDGAYFLEPCSASSWANLMLSKREQVVSYRPESLTYFSKNTKNWEYWIRFLINKSSHQG